MAVRPVGLNILTTQAVSCDNDEFLFCRCAGLCQYEGRGGLCVIKLSEPLLKLRPRRDLVETLLVSSCVERTL